MLRDRVALRHHWVGDAPGSQIEDLVLKKKDFAQLKADGLDAWFIRALRRQARNDSGRLAKMLLSFEEPGYLDGTKSRFRTHFLAHDGTGSPVIGKLARHLASEIVFFCIPRARVREAERAHIKQGDPRKLFRLNSEARKLFTTLENSGEGGELLLYALLESILGIPQILCKMPHKTNTEMHVHGTDGIHAQALPGGRLALYWGESKLHKSVSSAISECFESIEPFLHAARDGELPQDILLARDNLDAGSKRLNRRLIKFFDEESPDSLKVEVRAACLVGFSVDNYPDLADAEETLRSEWAKAVTAWKASAKGKIEALNLVSFEIELFCIPFPSVDIFRRTMLAEIGAVK
jgi:hypothetical protein